MPSTEHVHLVSLAMLHPVSSDLQHHGMVWGLILCWIMKCKNNVKCKQSCDRKWKLIRSYFMKGLHSSLHLQSICKRSKKTWSKRFFFFSRIQFNIIWFAKLGTQLLISICHESIRKVVRTLPPSFKLSHMDKIYCHQDETKQCRYLATYLSHNQVQN